MVVNILGGWYVPDEDGVWNFHVMMVNVSNTLACWLPFAFIAYTMSHQNEGGNRRGRRTNGVLN